MARGFVFQVAKDASTKDVFCAEYYFGMEDDVGCDYFCDLNSTEAAKRCIYDFLKSLEKKGIGVDYDANSFTLEKKSKLVVDILIVYRHYSMAMGKIIERLSLFI